MTALNEQKKKTLSINRFVLLFITVIDLILAFGYMQEIDEGNMPEGIVRFLIALFLVTLTINWIVYLRDKSSELF